MDAMQAAIEASMLKAGITQLKEKQRQCIIQFISGHDVFASLPTGYGKSLILIVRFQYDTYVK